MSASPHASVRQPVRTSASACKSLILVSSSTNHAYDPTTDVSNHCDENILISTTKDVNTDAIQGDVSV